jgi:poly-gamma-glutamate synthesis protein (capsule biosynthesis protein)
MICFFSLGNFLSAQNELPRILGGMMRVVIKKTASEPHTVTVEEAELLPLVTHYEAGYKNFGVYPLDEYTDDIASRHLLRPPAASSLASYLKRALVEAFIPMKTAPSMP